MSDLKRVCIINVKDIQEEDETILPGERVMRTSRAYAQELVNTGVWKPCAKSKLKSFLNKNKKLTRNMRTIQVMMDITGHDFPEKRERVSHGTGSKAFSMIPTFKYEHADGRKYTPLFSRGQKMVETGKKKVIMAFP